MRSVTSTGSTQSYPFKAFESRHETDTNFILQNINATSMISIILCIIIYVQRSNTLRKKLWVFMLVCRLLVARLESPEILLVLPVNSAQRQDSDEGIFEHCIGECVAQWVQTTVDIRQKPRELKK